MIVVLDTNIWITEVGLKSSLGAVTRFYINKEGAKIALPEVVRLEVEHNLRNNIKELISELQKNYRYLLAIFGSLKELIVPTDIDIEKKISIVFYDLGVELIGIPFTFDAAKSSFIRTIDKVAPCDIKQEFKDGVLWAECVNLLDQDDVRLVTNDKAFFDGRDYKNGLATTLRHEIAGKTHELKIMSNLSDLLSDLKTDVELDDDLIAQFLFEYKHKRIHELMNKYMYELGKRKLLKKKVFVTGNPKILFIEYDISYECHDISGENKDIGIITIKGDCNYNLDTNSCENIRDFGQEFMYNDAEGRKTIRDFIIHTEGIYIGHKTISHKIRKEIQ
jgi:hypothetical protein